MRRSYDEVVYEVEQIVDGTGLPIDIGIKKAVVALRLWEFPTTGSCEGHLDRGLSCPWVEIYEPQQEGASWKRANNYQRQKLTKLLNEFYNATRNQHLFSYEDIGVFGGFRLINESPWSHSNSSDYLNTQRKDFDIFANFLIKNFKSINVGPQY